MCCVAFLIVCVTLLASFFLPSLISHLSCVGSVLLLCGYEFWEEEEILDNDMKPKEEILDNEMKPKEEIPFPFYFTYYYTL